jgi:hypothetical protein
MNGAKRLPLWLVWPMWVVATAVGTSLGAGVVWLAGNALGSLLEESGDVAAVVGGLASMGMAFVVPGSLMGLLQWTILRRSLPAVGWWVSLTVLGTALGVIVLGAIFALSVGLANDESPWGLIIAGIAAGMTCGSTQFAALRQPWRRAPLWIAASGLGGSAAPLIFLSLTRGADLAAVGIASIINGAAAAGACYGAATGLAVVWIARSSVPETPQRTITTAPSA